MGQSLALRAGILLVTLFICACGDFTATPDRAGPEPTPGGVVTVGRGDQAGPSTDGERRIAELRTVVERLHPLEVPIEPAQPGDWLAVHFEPGQTFEQYRGSRPQAAGGERRVLYVQPLGDFSPAQRRVVGLTGSFLRRFFGLPLQVLSEVPLARVPAEAQRRHPEWGDQQVLTGWVLDQLLAPSLPDDAAAVICLTSSDLWPGEGWNFVFGQADLRRRVAVWSLYRNGDPSDGGDAFRVCLRRTLQTAAHELCHVFGLYHEVRYRCLMNGSNHREEADRRPLWLCPESLAKLCWATGRDPRDHCRQVLELLKEQGLDGDAALYRRALELLSEGRAGDRDHGASGRRE